MRCRLDARPEPHRVNENRVSGRNPLGLGTALRAIAGLFSRSRRSSQDEIQTADQRRWTFDWPEELLAREVVARTEDFAAWLRENGWRELSRRQLISRTGNSSRLPVLGRSPVGGASIDPCAVLASGEFGLPLGRASTDTDWRPLVRNSSRAPTRMVPRSACAAWPDVFYFRDFLRISTRICPPGVHEKGT